MKARLLALIDTVRDEPKRLAYWLALGLLVFWIVRGCIPGKSLPREIAEEIDRTYITCISPDDTPIQPGVARQPECGKVNLEMVEEGVIPALEQADGVTRAICYRILVEYPRWQTMGQTRHEVLWSEHRYSKVAVLKNGEWQTFPAEDRQDEQRWLEFGCSELYESE
jgi:hypothetical protein